MNYRDLFEGIETPVKLQNGSYIVPINFDNGATTPPFKSVINTILEDIKYYGPISRGLGQKGDICTQKFEDAREEVLKFFNLKESNTHTVVFTKSDTESLNILSDILIKGKDIKVMTTRMEHHANDLPWRYSSSVVYIDVDEFGRVNIDDIEKKLIENKGRIKYVSITAASNVTGYVNPINHIAKICHKYDAKIIIDAAQLVAHQEINMKGETDDEQIDFLTFSAHKAYAPFGSGALVGLVEDLSNVDPFLKGGGCVKGVFDDNVLWGLPPQLHEAGTQNFLGVMGMVQALKDLKEIGFDNISKHESDIKDHLIKEMNKINNLIVYGDSVNTQDRLGVISFNVKNMNYEKVAQKMAKDMAIALRCGKFCAHPYVYRLLNISDMNAYIDVSSGLENIGMIRASLGLYNTIEEANIFLNALEYIAKNN
ncbi:aminotransferase class V-fold PLP-dependent enzyme [[Clostridium] dakarense]|uniref:aminotransferase class V-fold PLP-dependent enzyme n=1 Tax=Faecalimicrobium dakarense TaxID=1301100 RepID=UPI0004B240CC|nr:aminotransferase class V-fold PLP-dependent enzyme [[Clostridium] dakarense]